MSKLMDTVVVYAQSFVDSFGADCGARLEEIASAIGLRIEEVAAETFDGALVRIAGKPVGKVLLNKGIREEGRRLFTLAHEIGHYILPAHSKSDALCRSREVQNWAPALSQREIEANRFAAEILMAREAIIDQLRMEPSFKVVRHVRIPAKPITIPG
jgi:Zn-dependent peptidase ImmA (M78 family)